MESLLARPKSTHPEVMLAGRLQVIFLRETNYGFPQEIFERLLDEVRAYDNAVSLKLGGTSAELS